MSCSGKAKILIIEDEASFRCFYRDMLEAAGYDILEAEDGEAGWALAKSEKPDLILLDLVLPKLGGFEILRSVRGYSETKGIPVIIMSALGRQEDIWEGFSLGANEYLQKGLFSSRRVLAEVRSAIERAERKADAAYKLAIGEARTGAERLKADTGMMELFSCPHCEGELLLALNPDLTRTDRHWFSSYFICSKCKRTV
jgi:DNA-binding response OmpR family regulator